MNSTIDVSGIRKFGALYVAQGRLRAMSKWKGIIAVVDIGNPLFYLIAMGIGIGVLVNQNSGSSGTGGVEYLTFLAPALLASAAITGGMDEVVFPTLEGFKWRKQFFGINSTPITGGQIALGVFLAAMVRVIFSVTAYWILLILFGVLPISSWFVPVIALLGGAAFSSVMMAVVAGITKDDYFLTVLGRLVITPLFLFSGTFFPLSNMPTYLHFIGWISPLWHTSELGRHFAYGYEVSPLMLLVHFLFLGSLLALGFTSANRRFSRRLLK